LRTFRQPFAKSRAFHRGGTNKCLFLALSLNLQG
jgi:hypothetical protein